MVVPKLRFKGFNTVYKTILFGDVVTNKSDKYNPLLNEQSFKCIELEHMESNNGSLNGFTDSKLQASIKNVFNPDSVLYGKLRPYLNKFYYSNFSGVCSSEIWVLSSLDNNKLINPYLYYLIQTSKYSNLAAQSTGSKMPRADWSILSETEFEIPVIEEQKKISSFLKKVDVRVQLQQEKIELLKEQKKEYMRKIFKHKWRFEAFNQEWKDTMIGALAEISRGASPRPIQDPKWFDESSNIGWLRISDVTKQNGRIHYLEQKISILGQQKTRVLEKPHLLLSIAATVGKPVINYIPTGVHDGFLIFYNPTFNVEFMFQWLEMFRDNWQKYGQPGSQVNLNSELVKNQEISIPSVEEQEKIAGFLSTMDKKIKLHEKKLELSQTQKQAFMQQMFI